MRIYLSVCLSILWLSISLPSYLAVIYLFLLSIYLSIPLYLYLFFCPYNFLYLYLHLYLSISLSIYLTLSSYLFIYLAIYPSIWKEALMRDFLQKWKLTGPKQSKSTRLPQKIEVHSSKMKKYCETSSILEMESWVQSWQPRTNGQILLQYIWYDHSTLTILKAGHQNPKKGYPSSNTGISSKFWL